MTKEKIMDIVKQIESGKTSIGIEFGSTRIKAVMIGEDYSPIASGTHDWQNRLEGGIWTYTDEDITLGLQDAYKNLADCVKKEYGVSIRKVAAIGISAMMHGYLAFDEGGNLLAPFRTWRNTITGEAAKALTEAFGFNIPQRWSIAHLYQAVLSGEEHVPDIKFFTTLAGYVHWQLTGEKVLGVGDASGMFPIDPGTHDYDKTMLSKFKELVADKGFAWTLESILPRIVPAGESAGTLTEAGAKLLDPSGELEAGITLCAPEGDAGTGMVATNSIAPRTGNVSAGTSIFAMAVLEKNLSKVHEEIDIVTTPCGDPVAMVHCNNCTTDLDAWVKMFASALKTFGVDVPKSELYDKLYAAALSAPADCGGLVSCNYFSGEHVTGFTEGRPMLIRTPEAQFDVSTLMRSLIYSCMATLKIGMDILLGEEKVELDKLLAHGGLFKAPVVGQRFLASALGVPVAVMSSAGEGGAWGIALLAAFTARENKAQSLADFLDEQVFSRFESSVMQPDADDSKGFAAYTERFKAGLAAQRAAVEAIH